jgi:hypothetical protein
MENKLNTKYKIKTPSGWSDFTGIQKVIRNGKIRITFSNDVFIICSLDHLFLTADGWKEAKYLTTETVLYHRTEGPIIPIAIEKTDMGIYEYYDVLDTTNHQYYTNDIVSHNCEFLGSSHTLISSAKLRTMAYVNPKYSQNGFDIIEESVPGRTYALMVDVARGQGLDYSAFSVIDVTEIPYRQVAKYRNNEISALLYPTIVYNAARKYNDAYVLVEISDIGQQISDILHYELEYENLVKVQVKGRQGLQVSAGHVKKIAFGLKQSVATKRIGCANLKTLIESDKLIVQDADTIMELTTFTSQKDSFKAEDGNHDDLAMTLVLFGWFTAQRHFKDALKEDIRKVLQQEQLNITDEDMAPFGIIDNGVDNTIDNDDRLFDNWMNERMKKYPLDSYEYDYKGDFFKKG